MVTSEFFPLSGRFSNESRSRNQTLILHPLAPNYQEYFTGFEAFSQPNSSAPVNHRNLRRLYIAI
jgi:hypothetical protein